MEQVTHSAAETERLGRALGLALGGEIVAPGRRPIVPGGTPGALGAGTTWLLSGEMGAGKTVLIRGITRGLGVRGRIRSPGFTLVTSYRGTLPVVHVDLYRLEDEGLVADLGLLDLVPDRGILLIEWGERAQGAVDRDHFVFCLEHRGGDRRLIRLEARGPRSAAVGRELARALGWPDVEAARGTMTKGTRSQETAHPC